MSNTEVNNKQTPKQTRDSKTSRWNTRQLATMALLTALGVVFSFIEIPITGPVLLYDPSNTAAMIGGLAFGPGAGAVIGVLSTCIHGVFKGDFAGTLINLVAVISFVVPAAAVYRRYPSIKGCIVGLAIGCVASFAFTVPMNFVVWPIYAGMSFSDVVDFLPVLAPFNLAKIALNGIVSFALFKSLEKLLRQGE